MKSQTRLKARKRFGQNFLIDELIIDSILSLVDPLPSDRFIEIGPGRGAITSCLLKSGCDLTLIELDRELIPGLLARFASKSPNRCRLINQDIMRVDFSQFTAPLRILGNLPYNISTPLMFKLLKDGHRFTDVHVMLQREVANRLCSLPGDGIYGRLGVMIQATASVELLVDVPSECFMPKPKVDSSFVRIIPKSERLAKVQSMATLALIVRTAFAQRRKTLKNNFTNLISAFELELNGINPQARAESIPVDKYVELANFVARRDST